jgi:2-polyprenyl-3-methyl-5-hydroxy-6-metoxy-1,4-benzoquinol methylase
MDEGSEDEIMRQWSAAFRASAAEFGPEGDFGRKHLLNPALFDLLGDVKGQRILDAGCGQGYLSRMLARRGAHVTGIEFAPPGYEYAVQEEQRTPLGIEFLRGDLTRPFGLESSFDSVVANMVFMDIEDYQAAMRNCLRALCPNGRFVFSLLHPCFEEPSSAWPGQRFVAVREYLRPHRFEQDLAYGFHRPLSHYLNFVTGQGCHIERVVEPQLTPELATANPVYVRNVHVPSYIVISAVKLARA